MRSTLLATVTLFSLALSGCDNAPRPSPTTPGLDPDEQALQSFETTAPDTMRSSYAAFEPTQQAALWRAQLRRSITRTDLTVAQRDLLRELSAHAEEYLHDGLSEAQLARYEAPFTDRQKVEIFEHLGAARPTSPKAGAGGPTQYAPPSGTSCDTRWCSCCVCCAPPCPEPTVTWTCSTGCSTTNGGCGVLWLQDCTKTCDYTDL